MASTSPLLNPTRRRLSSRRNSVSAPDPHNVTPHFANPDCASSSRITILRLPPSAIETPPETASLSRRSSWGAARPGSSGGRPNSNGGGGANGGRSPRVSFAFSSFGPAKPASGGSGQGPNSSSASDGGGSRPGSPTFHRNHHRSPSWSSKDVSQPQLTPQQILELAHASLSPKPSPTSSPTISYTPLLPGSGPVAPPGGASPSPNGAKPATFLSMSQDEYLPFLDRPSEVYSLISTPPTSRLFGLLTQTFPLHLRTLPEGATEHDYDADPRVWPLPTLYAFLTTVPREVAPDAAWTRAVRRCVISRSESVWVRLKGALGVPPELEGDSDEEGGVNVEVEDDPFLTSSSSEEGDAEEPEEEEEEPREVIFEPIFSPEELLPANGLAGSGGLIGGSPAMNMIASPIDISPGAAGHPEQSPVITNVPLESIGEGEEPEEPPLGAGGLEVNLVPATPQLDTSDPSGAHAGWMEPEPEIHALRISTSTVVPEFTPSTPIVSPVVSPTAGKGQNYQAAFAHRSARRPSSAAEIQRERQHALGERELVRTPGNPLFVGSFARLDVGPTLNTRQPTHRNSLPPALSRPFSFSRRARGAGLGLRSGLGIEYDASDFNRHDYAISSGSGSERSFR